MYDSPRHVAMSADPVPDLAHALSVTSAGASCAAGTNTSTDLSLSWKRKDTPHPLATCSRRSMYSWPLSFQSVRHAAFKLGVSKAPTTRTPPTAAMELYGDAECLAMSDVYDSPRHVAMSADPGTPHALATCSLECRCGSPGRSGKDSCSRLRNESKHVSFDEESNQWSLDEESNQWSLDEEHDRMMEEELERFNLAMLNEEALSWRLYKVEERHIDDILQRIAFFWEQSAASQAEVSCIACA